MNIYETLNKLNIKYEEITHEAVYTVEQAQNIKEKINGIGCKNLFLKDKLNNYYLYILKDNKKADLKNLSLILKTTHLTFAKEEDLFNILNLSKGSVTPLGIINDKKHLTILIIDKELENNKLLVHPNTNEKTISIEYNDLIRFIKFCNNKYFII